MAKLISSLSCLSRCFEEGRWSEQEVICANEWLYCNNVFLLGLFSSSPNNLLCIFSAHTAKRMHRILQKLRQGMKSLIFNIPSSKLIIVAVNIKLNRPNPQIFTSLSLRLGEMLLQGTEPCQCSQLIGLAMQQRKSLAMLCSCRVFTDRFSAVN